MGTFENGPVGGFSGKVGPVVGSSWKGKSVIRSRPPSKRKGEPSKLQLASQTRFGLMSHFLRPINGLLMRTFKKYAIGMTGFHKALSKNYDLLLIGDYPNYSVNYAALELSKGSLSNADSISVASTATGLLQFRWTDNSEQALNALISDYAFMAVYCEEQDRWISNEKATTRNMESFTMDVKPLSGFTVHAYLGFISADGRQVSRTQYLGMLKVV